MKKKLHLYVLIAAALLPLRGWAQDQNAEFEIRKLTREETETVAHRALSIYPKEIAQRPLESYTDLKYPDFYFFCPARSLPIRPDEVSIDQLAVDALTADVWNVTKCKEVFTADLYKMQRMMRSRVKLSKNGYQILRRRGPGC